MRRGLRLVTSIRSPAPVESRLPKRPALDGWINQRYILRVEEGDRGCNLRMAQKLAEALEVDLQEIRTKYESEHELEPAADPVSRRRWSRDQGPRGQGTSTGGCTKRT